MYNNVTKIGGIALRKQTLGKRYLKLATKKPLFYYAFLLLGLMIFLYLTLTTRIHTSEGDKRLMEIIYFRGGRSL